MIERAMIVSTGARLRLDLAMAFGSSRSTVSDHEKENPNSSNAKIIKSDDLNRLERDSIVAALVRAHRMSRTGGVAELLGVNPKYAWLVNAFARNQPQESSLFLVTFGWNYTATSIATDDCAYLVERTSKTRQRFPAEFHEQTSREFTEQVLVDVPLAVMTINS
jgi:hypothetical protein